jgi:phospholipid/cholesterol/gamma-HCH transport system substrate-binding protein
MENKAHALAAGVFVLLLGALLTALAIWLTRDARVRQAYELVTREAVTGLQPQANVRFRGVNVGKVAHIGFDPQVPGQVLVRIAVNEDAPITRSTFASLGFQGVTGLAFVQLDDSGESTQKLAAPDGQLARIPLRPGLVSQLSEQGARLLRELEESSRRVNQLLAPENQKAVTGALNHLGHAAASLPPLVRDARATLASLQSTSASVAGSADEAKNTAAEFSRLAQQVQQPGGTLDRLQQSASALADSGQTLQTETLPRLNRALDDVSQAARQAGRTARLLGDHPQSLIFGLPAPAREPAEPAGAAPASKP